MQSKMASKCGVIIILSLLLLIPLMLIKGQIAERQNYQNQVEADIARSWTGRQLVSMPILVQPYQIQYQSENTTKVFTETRFLYQVASNAQIHVNIATEYRQRGIYKVPVYLAKIDQQGGIDLGKLQTKKNTAEQLNGFNGFEEPYLTIHVSDPRGLENDLTAKIHNESHELLPGSRLQSLAQGFHIPLRVQITNITSAEYLHYHLSYSLRGMVAFGVLPSAQSLNMEIQSDWQHPNFNGSFLPRSRTINSKGFSAFWSINPFSSGMNDSIYGCTKDDCSSLLKKAFGVHLIEPVNIYLQAERAVKYGILIVVVCFVCFFIFEVLSKLRIHPIQYTMVGLAIAIFYLILVSLSEHTSFATAYLSAAASCTCLLFIYLISVFGNRVHPFIFCLGMTVIHATLYIILQLEDFALLMGTLLLFSLLALLMISTRKINWYATEFKL